MVAIAKTPLVLFVDDDSLMLQVLIGIATQLGFDFKVAENGVEALKLVKTSPFDTIISDLRMPKMDGLELLQAVLELGFIYPFIIVTGFGDKESTVRALRLGAFNFIEKPYSVSAMEEVLKESVAISNAMQYITKFSSSERTDEPEIKQIQRLAKLSAFKKGS